MKYSLFALVVLLICAGNSAAQLSLGKESLKGLGAVRVVVEDFNGPLIEVGLNKDQIQQDVELRLRKSGIKVTSQDASVPYIDVLIGGAKVPRTSAMVYAMTLDLYQPVLLQRDPSTKLYASTWSSSLAVAAFANVTLLRNYVGDLVDSFINDYLSQNQR
jgi:hypothetical protein